MRQKDLTTLQVTVVTYNGVLTYGMDVDEHPMDGSMYYDYWFELYDPVTGTLDTIGEKIRGECWEEQDPVGKIPTKLRTMLGKHIEAISDIHLLQMIAGRLLTEKGKDDSIT